MVGPTWTRRRADAPEPALLIVIEPLLEQKDSRGERVCQMTGKKPLPATRYRNPLPARPAFRRQESPDIRHLVSRVWPGWSIIEGRLRDGTQHGAVFCGLGWGLFFVCVFWGWGWGCGCGGRGGVGGAGFCRRRGHQHDCRHRHLWVLR